MIARIRGEHDADWGRWRSSASREDTAPGSQRVTVPKNELAATRADSQPRRTRSQPRVAHRLVGLAAVMIAGYFAVSWSGAELSSHPVRPRLPATPRGWLDAYEAAAIDNPGRVCSELFAPQLAQAYGNVVHGGCNGYSLRSRASR